jgi:hypothetical protein
MVTVSCQKTTQKKAPKTYKEGSIFILQTFGVNVNPEREGILKRVKMTAGIIESSLSFRLSTDVLRHTSNN